MRVWESISTIVVLTVLQSGCAHHSVNREKVHLFSNNDTVVFVGDSITHGGGYHVNIALFNATRYPDHKIIYVNAGISGDTAEGTIKRFDRDIAIHNPTVATIMLGMNDVGSYLYENPVSTEKEKATLIVKQEEIRERYLSNMNTLAKMLAKTGSKLIFITPSIYDETAELTKPAHIGQNSELAVYGKSVAELAEKYQASVVDFQEPMLTVNKAIQAVDPAQTIVSKDRVHPEAPGHLLMAHAFLMAQKESQFVSNIQLNATKRKVEQFDNCNLQGIVSFNVNQLEFSCIPHSLPFPIEGEQRKALDWIPFNEDLNMQRFAVSGLSEGKYTLSINATITGEYSKEALAEGINLAHNRHTPMYLRALEVKRLNDERAQVGRKIRDLAQVTYSMLDKYPELDRSNTEAVRETLFHHVEESAGKPWYYYLKKQVKTYLAERDNLSALRARMQALEAKMYRANQSDVTHWKLVKVL